MRTIRAAAQTVPRKNATIWIVAHCEDIQKTAKAHTQHEKNEIKKIGHHIHNENPVKKDTAADYYYLKHCRWLYNRTDRSNQHNNNWE